MPVDCGTNPASLHNLGDVFACGYNKFGQLGLTSLEEFPEVGVSVKSKVPADLFPRRVKALKGIVIASISAGENHTAAR
jgi:alpha-tubulin suppressor-like RCC1 family protein